MYSKVSSYQVKRWLDKQWNEQEELEKYITKLNIESLRKKSQIYSESIISRKTCVNIS